MADKIQITPEEVLNIALSKEHASFRFYDRMLNLESVELIQDLLQELKNEEYRHVKRIEKQLAKLRSG